MLLETSVTMFWMVWRKTTMAKCKIVLSFCDIWQVCTYNTHLSGFGKYYIFWNDETNTSYSCFASFSVLMLSAIKYIIKLFSTIGKNNRAIVVWMAFRDMWTFQTLFRLLIFVFSDPHYLYHFRRSQKDRNGQDIFVKKKKKKKKRLSVSCKTFVGVNWIC